MRAMAAPRILVAIVAVIAVALGLFVWSRSAGGGRAVAPEVARRPEVLEPTAELAPVEAPASVGGRAASDAARTDPSNAGVADEAGPFRGLVVDRATGEPVPFLVINMDGGGVRVDAQGRFAFERPLKSEYHAVFVQGDTQSIRVVPIGELVQADSGWRVPIEIGPTFHLDVEDRTAETLTGWIARLVEEGADGSVVRGDPVPVMTRTPPFVRLENPWSPNAPGSTYRIEIQNPEGTLEGRSASFSSAAVGIHPETVRIVVDRELAASTGRVVDERQQPCPGAKVAILPEGSGTEEHIEGHLLLETDGDGAFDVSGLVPGDYRFIVRWRRGQQPLAWSVTLPPGLSEIPDFVVPGGPAASIEGRLVSRTGVRLSPTQVRLRSLDGSFEAISPSRPPGPRPAREPDGSWGAVDGGPATGHVFEFDDVPEGGYELTVLENVHAWSPRSIPVRPPTNEPIFVREDDVATTELRFEAFDAETGQPLRSLLVQMQAGATWNPNVTEAVGGVFRALPTDLAFQWTAHAPGYRSAFGDQSSFEEVDGVRVATVHLERGWSARLILVDVGLAYWLDDGPWRLAAGAQPPVAGAEVWLDGVLAGTSDRYGVVELSGAFPPEHLEIRGTGWRAVDSRGFADGQLLGEARDVRIWLVPE